MLCSQLLQLSLLTFATLGQASALRASTAQDLSSENDMINTFDVTQVDANENKQFRIPSVAHHDEGGHEDSIPAEPAVTSIPAVELDIAILRPVVHVPKTRGGAYKSANGGFMIAKTLLLNMYTMDATGSKNEPTMALSRPRCSIVLASNSGGTHSTAHAI
ncbi:hypothetical protein CERZMDRAFT_97340 [Cercospora zeae-maydis SCOH1-5]|uniref:Uncharacterized protein n=1 Tax=Cercospora zeae-maydis SCOH1-5 TaxID=717836 RepID=A0A6A6FHE9_9PEZI|nr:hypothetical protein CERZMDRAFT_97340 [Cercospora zeae-maydis SCOH1-5]